MLADRFAPAKIDVFETLGYTPTERQAVFHAATEFDVLYGGAAGGGKMLPVTEQIPTPSGWTTMGELRPGDEVFTETGATCHVTAVHPVDETPASYRLTFDDGTVMDACADHEWLTYDARELEALTRRSPEFRARRRGARTSRATGLRSDRFTAAITERNRVQPPAALDAPAGSVRTTAQIAATLRTSRGRANHAVPVAGALDLPEVALPLPPYVLGAWLGDGHSANAGFTSADPEVLDAIRAEGISVTSVSSDRRPYAYVLGERVTAVRAGGRPGAVNTVAALLRELGVIDNKHVPAAYLRASTDQRLALLQGLMDTDGTANKAGQVEFVTTRREIAEGVHELIVSLGWKVRLREGRATFRGKDCGPKWTLKWSPSVIVFRLPRKAERQKVAERRTTRFRYIVECEPITPEPMRCITVDNPTSLYLAGRSMVPTHNSKALLMEGLRVCVQHPGIRVGAFRRTFPELEESLLAELAQVDYAKALGCRYERVAHNLKFPNGSILMFRYARNLPDATVRQGGQYQLLLFDELTLFPAEVVAFLSSRLRSGNGLPVIGVRAGSNPGGAGHGEARKRYIDATDKGATVFTDKRGRTVRFIPSKVDDNPHVNAEYKHDLDALPEAMRKAFRDGSWDSFSGQVFTEWDEDRHVVPRFQIPKTWLRWQGIDYGWAAPWVVLWAAEDQDKRVWVYREVTKTKVIERDQARTVLDLEAGENVNVRAADPAMWARTGAALSVAAQYAAEGVHLEPAHNDRLIGKQRVHSYLADGPACAHHRELGWDTCPMLHVLEGTAPELVRTLPSLPYDQRHPEDVDTAAEDHHYDALRYLLFAIGGGPEFPTGPTSANPGALPTSAPASTPTAAATPDWGTSPRRGGGGVVTAPD